MTRDAQGWTAHTLGTPRLEGPQGPVRLERRGALLLAHLALEGPRPRAELAAWLWPGSAPDTAADNLRHLLRRLRAAGGGQAWTGPAEEGRVGLAPGARVDAALLRAAAGAARHAEVLAWEGRLLDGVELEDCPDADAWLDAQRVRVEDWRRRASEAEVRRREAAGDAAGALEVALRWQQREPESEEACRCLMALLAAQGEGARALDAYARLRAHLREELDVGPAPETAALARRIERGEGAVTPVPVPAVPLPLLRPPVLAGRERAWAQVAEAWAAGQAVLLAGEAGAGKTRLAEELCEARGRWCRLAVAPPAEGPGRAAPHAALAHTLHEALAHGAAPALPPWARAELTRAQGPGAGTGPDVLRRHEALAVALAALLDGHDAVLLDDVHHLDDASVAVLASVCARPSAEGGRRLVACYRPEALGARAHADVLRLVEAGGGRVVELTPLGPGDVARVLEGLEAGGLAAHAEALWRLTGGNPLFLVEAVRGLLAGPLPAHGVEALPVPPRVRALLEARVAALAPAARGVLEVAALSGDAFAPALAERVLGLPGVRVAEALGELERARLLAGRRFTCGLLRQVVADGAQGAPHAAAARSDG